MEVTIAEDRLKEVLKAAVVEVLEERGDLVREIVEEAMEDLALARAIHEGEGSEVVSRDQIFSFTITASKSASIVSG